MIRRALISVTDKAGVVEFAKGLVEEGDPWGRYRGRRSRRLHRVPGDDGRPSEDPAPEGAWWSFGAP